jgi:hypothetical protein
MTFVPFADAEVIGDRFLALLDRHGIQPPTGSRIEDELLSLTQLMEVARNPNLVPASVRPAVFRSAAGIHDLAAKLLSVEPIAEFAEFLPHLKLIGEGKIPTATLGQNAASPQSDDTSRKIAELYLGCLAAHAGTNVRLDSPTNAKGDNPDIIFRLEPDSKPGRDWAIAIKTISSTSGQTIFERIKEGAAQVDASACLADVGIVVINTKSALDHPALWNVTFPTPGDAGAALVAQVKALTDAADKDRPCEEWEAVFAGKVVRPVLFLAQTLVRISTWAGRETPTALKMLIAHNPCGQPDPEAHALAEFLNKLMHKVLLGTPGSFATAGTTGSLPA